MCKPASRCGSDSKLRASAVKPPARDSGEIPTAGLGVDKPARAQGSRGHRVLAIPRGWGPRPRPRLLGLRCASARPAEPAASAETPGLPPPTLMRPARGKGTGRRPGVGSGRRGEERPRARVSHGGRKMLPIAWHTRGSETHQADLPQAPSSGHHGLSYARKACRRGKR